MGILGKILLVVNLLLGAGFAYLAIQDWQGRQTIEASGLRHLMLLNGLPLGDRAGDPADMPTDQEAEIPFAMLGPGNKPIQTVSVDLLKAYFQAVKVAPAADGQITLAVNTPVPNQLAEVKRTQGLMRGYIDRQDGPAQKAQAAGSRLLFLAETFDERASIQDLMAKANGEELLRRLNQKFDQVLTPPRAPDVSALAAGDNEDANAIKDRLTKASELRESGVKDIAERRARIAHLLVHLDSDAAWQKRVLMVVGAREYVKAVVLQSIRLREMTQRVERTIFDDQDQFIAKYAQERGLAIQRTQTVRDAEETQARLATQALKDEEIVKQRETHLAEVKTQLERVKGEVNQLLARQTLTEQQLFAVQREVAAILDDIYELQDQLIRKELEAYRKQ